MKKCFIYARTGSQLQSLMGAGIATQIGKMKNLAKKIGRTVISVFSDVASANAKNRPGFEEMMVRIEKGEADCILCTDLVRLTRNSLTTTRLMSLVEKGLKIITPTQSFQNDADSLFTMTLQTGMAERYSRSISALIKRGIWTKKHPRYLCYRRRST